MFPLPEEGQPLLLITASTLDLGPSGAWTGTNCPLHDTSFHGARRHPVSFQRQPTVLPGYDAYGSQ